MDNGVVKLYRSSAHPYHWIVYSDIDGWLIFPATVNGWHERREATELHPDELFQVPLRLAFNTGLHEAIEAQALKLVA